MVKFGKIWLSTNSEIGRSVHYIELAKAFTKLTLITSSTTAACAIGIVHFHGNWLCEETDLPNHFDHHQFLQFLSKPACK